MSTQEKSEKSQKFNEKAMKATCLVAFCRYSNGKPARNTKQAHESKWLACRMPMRHSSPAATNLYFPYEA